MPISAQVYKQIVAAKQYMDEHFHEPIGQEQIARQACLSRFHFHRLFTRVYRTTPYQYLTRKRVEQARLWLASEDCTVSEVGNNVGFESAGSFSLLFKKETGIPPVDFRQKAKQKQQQAIQQPRKFIPHCHIAQFSNFE